MAVLERNYATFLTLLEVSMALQVKYHDSSWNLMCRIDVSRIIVNISAEEFLDRPLDFTEAVADPGLQELHFCSALELGNLLIQLIHVKFHVDSTSKTHLLAML